MKIDFLVNYVHGGWSPDDTRLGGTEESVVEWANELGARGHKVRIYNNDTRNDYAGGADICINIKSADIDPIGPTLYLTNETDAYDKDLSMYDGVIWPSEYARDNIPVNNRTFILPHGYDAVNIYPGDKVPKQCLYASSPDRGLMDLLRIWPQVLEAHPDATLMVTYAAEPFDVPGVTFWNATEEEMNHLYRTSDIWAYPCNGGELFCMTGIKAQAAGCVPVIIPAMALKETVRKGVKAWPDGYTRALIRTLGDDKRKATIRRQLAKEHFVDWSESTDILLGIISEVIG